MGSKAHWDDPVSQAQILPPVLKIRSVAVVYLFGVPTNEEEYCQLLATFDSVLLAEQYVAGNTIFCYPSGVREFKSESLLAPYHRCFYQEKLVMHNPSPINK